MLEAKARSVSVTVPGHIHLVNIVSIEVKSCYGEQENTFE